MNDYTRRPNVRPCSTKLGNTKSHKRKKEKEKSKRIDKRENEMNEN